MFIVMTHLDTARLLPWHKKTRYSRARLSGKATGNDLYGVEQSEIEKSNRLLSFAWEGHNHRTVWLLYFIML